MVNTAYKWKQGDNCSPILFALFINELANDIIQSGKHGVTLSPEIIQILIMLFADDAVLLSTGIIGLQRQLDKSNIVIFRKGGHIASREKWLYGGIKLEVVNQYKYLGLIFSSGLTFFLFFRTNGP